MEAKLRVVEGAKPALIRLKLPTVIGRSRDATLKIKSSQISRNHCEIDHFEGELTVRDLGSSNGTYVNGHRIADVTYLSPGDELRIGALTLCAEYRLETPSATAPAAEAAPKTPDRKEPSGGSDQATATNADHVVGSEPTSEPSASEMSSIVRYEEDAQGSFIDIEEIDNAAHPNKSPDLPQDAASESSSANQPPIDVNVGQETESVDPADSQLNKFFEGLS